MNGRAVPVILTVTVSFNMQPPAAPRPMPPPPAAGATQPSAALPSIATAGLAASTDPDIEQGRKAIERRQYEDALRLFKHASNAHDKRCAECFYGMALATKFARGRTTSSSMPMESCECAARGPAPRKRRG